MDGSWSTPAEHTEHQFRILGVDVRSAVVAPLNVPASPCMATPFCKMRTPSDAGVGETGARKMLSLSGASSIAEGPRSDSVKMRLQCNLCLGRICDSRDDPPSSIGAT